jgi:magnesium chelatase family protein
VRYLGNEDRGRLHPEARSLPSSPDPGGPDFADIPGVDPPRRAAEVAVAGNHSLLLAAPAGAGQPLVARRIPSILPPLRQAEALEVLRIASASKEQSGSPTTGRPFRSPGRDVDFATALGGGHPATPGEISLAHNGVLYLDQVLLFDPAILDAIAMARCSRSTFIGSPPQAVPSAFLLVASTQLCPCGCFAAPDRLCSCDAADLARYQHRLAAAVESFDLVSTYGPPTREDLAGPPGEPSCAIRSRIMEARARQAARLGEGRTNQQMSVSETEDCGLTAESIEAINRAFPYPHMAGRRLQIANVARTIADLAGAELVDTFHLAEAVDLQHTPQSALPSSAATSAL